MITSIPFMTDKMTLTAFNITREKRACWLQSPSCILCCPEVHWSLRHETVWPSASSGDLLDKRSCIGWKWGLMAPKTSLSTLALCICCFTWFPLSTALSIIAVCALFLIISGRESHGSRDACQFHSSLYPIPGIGPGTWDIEWKTKGVNEWMNEWWWVLLLHPEQHLEMGCVMVLEKMKPNNNMGFLDYTHWIVKKIVIVLTKYCDKEGQRDGKGACHHTWQLQLDPIRWK